MSHLLQMRGLKQKRIKQFAKIIAVASFTDAWIETNNTDELKKENLSHLLQMRGLKQRRRRRCCLLPSRIFYRCVD